MLGSATAFQMYISCLVNTNQQASIDAAVRRRDSLLASSAVASTSTLNDKPAIQTANADLKSALSEADAPTSHLTSSQQLAQAVLAGQFQAASASTGAPGGGTMNFLGSSDQGTTTSPVQVTIVERQ